MNNQQKANPGDGAKLVAVVLALVAIVVLVIIFHDAGPQAPSGPAKSRIVGPQQKAAADELKDE